MDQHSVQDKKVLTFVIRVVQGCSTYRVVQARLPENQVVNIKAHRAVADVHVRRISQVGCRTNSSLSSRRGVWGWQRRLGASTAPHATFCRNPTAKLWKLVGPRYIHKASLSSADNYHTSWNGLGFSTAPSKMTNFHVSHS
jgi:hypothetical protein